MTAYWGLSWSYLANAEVRGALLNNKQLAARMYTPISMEGDSDAFDRVSHGGQLISGPEHRFRDTTPSVLAMLRSKGPGNTNNGHVKSLPGKGLGPRSPASRDI